jgi:ABC-type multidrug transport system permease subunit
LLERLEDLDEREADEFLSKCGRSFLSFALTGRFIIIIIWFFFFFFPTNIYLDFIRLFFFFPFLLSGL